MSKFIHVSIDIRAYLQKTDKQLARVFVDMASGQAIPAEEVRDRLVDYLRQGFEVVPVCDEHDDKGHCRGHETEVKV